MKHIINQIEVLADTITPIIAYQRIREVFSKSLLFECATYNDIKNSNSILVFDELASIQSEGELLSTNINGTTKSKNIVDLNYQDLISSFQNQLEITEDQKSTPFNGLYGFSGYDSVGLMESVNFSQKIEDRVIPNFYYGYFRFILIFNHFSNTLTIIENQPANESSSIDAIKRLLQKNQSTTYSFEAIGDEECNISENHFLKNVKKGIDHCQRGDVFQIVLSRQFNQKFIGDDFNVYRSLRSLNPSPYLFYADFGSFKLMGSSPEAQIVLNDNFAAIHPIAGTFRKTGDKAFDLQESERLRQDPKENAEHVMLVDLARNDLSRHCNDVKVEKYKEIQSFSHVIHLVSLVKGKLRSESSSLDLFAHTFPAGTLSGAPKIKAMNIINKLETTERSFYGGAIGSFGFDGSINHAIIIRSVCSKDNKLYYQAGAGVVIDSNPQSELQEVNNKLGALRSAINKATSIQQNSLKA